MTRTRAPGAAMAVAVLTLLLQWASPAGAQGQGTKLRVTAQSLFLAAGDTSFDLQVAVSPPPVAPLVLRIERYDDISNNSDPRGRLDAWLQGSRPRAADPQTFSTELVGVGGPISVPVSRDSRTRLSNGFNIVDAGVFPLVIRLETTDRRVVDEVVTFLLRLPEQTREQPPFKVAPILGLRAPVALRPDETRELPEADLDRLAQIQTLLVNNASARLTIEPQPETLASLPRTDPSLNTQTLRSAIGSRPVLPSTMVDIDVTGFVEAGLRDQVERQRQIGRDALIQAFGRPDESFDTGTFLARHPLSAEALAALATTAPRPVERVVVEAESVSPVESRSAGGDADLQPFALTHAAGRTSAVLWDQRLANRLKATDDAVLNAQATLADLMILACGRTGRAHCNSLPNVARGVALVVPDEAGAVRAFELVLYGLAVSQPWVLEQTDLPGLFALPAATAGRGGEPIVRSPQVHRAPETDLSGYEVRLAHVASRVNAYRSMLVTDAPEAPPGTEPPAARADRLVQLLDVAGAGAPAASDAYFDAVARKVETIFGAIHAPPQAPITLTSSEGEVQLRIESRLDHPVTVQVQLTSDKPVFAGGRRSVAVNHRLPAAPSSDTPSASSVLVQLEGLTSGTAPLDVRIVSPDGNVVLDTTKIEIRSTVVSWVGLVLTLAAGAFLVVWWARHFRDARRARKLVDVEDVDEAVAIATGEVPAVSGRR